MLLLEVKTLFVYAFLIIYTKADEEEDAKKEFLDIMVECSKESSPTPTEIEQLKEKKLTGDNIKCMFACVYKKTGMMTEKGEMSVDGINAISEKYFADDPETLKKAVAYAEACRSVNDEAVSDGEKGCDRAALLFKCTVDKAAEFDLSE